MVYYDLTPIKRVVPVGDEREKQYHRVCAHIANALLHEEKRAQYTSREVFYDNMKQDFKIYYNCFNMYKFIKSFVRYFVLIMCSCFFFFFFCI